MNERQKNNLAKFFYDIAKIDFAALVVAQFAICYSTQQIKPNNILDRVARTNSFVRDDAIKSWLILSSFIMCCSVSSVGCYNSSKIRFWTLFLGIIATVIPFLIAYSLDRKEDKNDRP